MEKENKLESLRKNEKSIQYQQLVNSFIKLLNLARQNINTKKRSKREYMPFEENKLDEFDKKKKNNLDKNNKKYKT